jgi:H+/Cl- antiporter ClcA
MNIRPASLPASVQRLLALLHVDFEPPQPPSNGEVLVASVVAIVLSLVVDALLVIIGTHLFPSTKGYRHFQFSDYAKLTVIGVIIACLGWPVVARITSRPKWLFFRLAIATTLVLLLPDLYIWHGGQPIKAVTVLMCMHLGIAYVTYQSLVILAPVRGQRHRFH